MTGKIIKGIAGFYYVYVVGSGIYECKAKGAFRKEGIKPLVGDDVEIDIVDEPGKKGNVTTILPRKSQLIRPAVANVDQALIIFAATSPEPNLNLLDRFLCMMEEAELPVVICFNKMDLVDQSFETSMRSIYEKAGYKMLFVSAHEGRDIDAIHQVLSGKTSTVAGPSGAGKSSITNLLTKGEVMETGALSEKIGRGKNTTRHSQLLPIDADSYLMDTPGFSSIFVPDLEPVDLTRLFPEFIEPSCDCRFRGCLHNKEIGCAVKEAVKIGHIAESRYENYLQILGEMISQKKY